MRGIPAIVLGSFPAIEDLRRGVVIFSCPDESGKRVVQRLREWSPGTSWMIVKREEPSVPGVQDETRFTNEVRTLAQQWRFILDLRSNRFDIAVMMWGGNEGYGLLKILPVFLNARSVLVFNENIDAFYLLVRNWQPVRNHWRSRKAGQSSAAGVRFAGRTIRSILLAPLGLVYVFVKASYLTARKNIRER